MIFDRDTNVSRTFLERARQMSMAVGRIAVVSEEGRPWGFGTGFLVSPEVVLTTNSVLPSAQAATASEILFDFYADADGSFAVPTVARFAPEVLFETNAELDVSVVALDVASGDLVRAKNRPFVDPSPSSGGVLTGEAVSLIHHPLGEPQSFSLRAGKVLGASGAFVEYDAPTQGGSAGAPVFDDNWRLVAIHSRHVLPGEQAGREPANAGPRADLVWDWLSTLPAAIDQLPRRLQSPPREPAARPVEPRPNAAATTAPDPGIIRDSVFISYAHADQKRLRFHEELELHLKGLPTVGPLRVWQDGRITAGTEWLPEIELALRRARVAVLLVGPHFLVSDFVRKKEIPALLEAARTEGVRIFPFVTHNVAYQESFLGRFQFYGEPDKPLENLDRAGRNKALVDLVRAIARVFEDSGP